MTMGARSDPGPAQAGDRRWSCHIDAHVHLYPCHPPEEVVAATVRNVVGAAGTAESACPPLAILLLADTELARGYDRLGEIGGDWQVDEPEPGALLCRNNRQGPLLVLAGYQLRTREGIEILSLCTTHKVDDKMPLGDAVAAIDAMSGIPVIPWGMGKWLGRRGDIVRTYLRSSEVPTAWLGDSFNRPRGWPEPSALAEASMLGRAILSGTDPLPFADTAQVVGSFGSLVETSIDFAYPLSSLRATLHTRPALAPYGRRQSPSRAIVEQTMLRLGRRRMRFDG